MSSSARDPAFEELLEYLRRNRGFDFTGYKRPSLMRRTARRMQVVGVEGYGEYQDYLEVHPEEFAYLFNTILINVTAFFRNPEAWDYLASHVVPKILEQTPEETIRIWSAGCASGEEPYTVGMLFSEALGLETARQRLKVYATDMDEEALARARRAVYSPDDVKPVPPPLREKYFEESAGSYTLNNDLRRIVIFGRHDLVHDAPISRLDLLICRNTLIYFNADTQRRILARFHFALNDDGFLFLGQAETLRSRSNLFELEALDHQISVKVPQLWPHERMYVLGEARDGGSGEPPDPYERLRQAVLENMPSAYLVVDHRGNLAMVNVGARDQFGIDQRDLGRPFRDLEVSFRPVELRSMIELARAETRRIQVTDVERRTRENEIQYMDVEVTPLFAKDNGGQGWLGAAVTFQDVTHYHLLKDDLERTNHELETAYEELQSTNEELETANEELQSTVEELQTTNEELQSSNEEVETSYEELQSTNEQLQAMNDELRETTADLHRSNAFLEGIVGSLRVGVVVVNRDLHVLLWNARAEDQWGLREEEVAGHSLLGLDIGLPVERLVQPLREFLTDECKTMELTLEAVTRRGRPLQVRITLNPLGLGMDCDRDGVVLLIEEQDGP